jgi:hypothetical protein
LSKEIATAITSQQIGEQIDETELEDELAELEQEALDNKMLKTGTVPVSDEIHRLPAAANGESKLLWYSLKVGVANVFLQSNPKPQYMPRKTTKKRNSEDYRLRWRCDWVIEWTHSFTLI